MTLSEPKKPKKTELVTIRFEKEKLENLRKDAKSKDISLNTLMGQIITKYLDYYSRAPGLGVIPMLDTQLKLIFKDFSKTDIQKMVRIWKKQYLEGMEASCNSEQTMETVVDSIENFGKTSGINIVKFETKESTALTLRHNCGKNFSIFFSEIWLDETGDLSKKIQTKITDQFLTFTIKK